MLKWEMPIFFGNYTGNAGDVLSLLDGTCWLVIPVAYPAFRHCPEMVLNMYFDTGYRETLAVNDVYTLECVKTVVCNYKSRLNARFVTIESH